MADPAIDHEPVTRIAAAMADGCIKDQDHSRVGEYNRLEPTSG